MEDAIFSPATMAGGLVEYDTDFGYIDELLFGGCWLETTDGSDFLGSSNSSSLFEPSFRWSAMDTNCGVNTKVAEKDGENSLLFEAPEKHFAKTSDLGEYSENCTFQGSELGRRWWIGPRANPGGGSSVMDRLIKAVGYINDLEKDKDVLIQVWIPENRGGRRVLRTSELAFSMNSSSERLAKYRDISVSYQFSAEENSKEGVGLPSRVFLGKIPEWSPDVQFFRSDEYARVDFAQQCGVRGTLALPVFDQGNRTCVGVIEVVMTTQQIKYSLELEIVCKALEAVDLRSSNVLGTPNAKLVYKGSYEALFPEIREVLGFACETHKLPLAQTWISCSEQGNMGCRHSDENYVDCVSTVEEACYVADPFFKAFHEACSEHHLLKGQGVAGEAFMTNGPCFSSDIRSFGNTKYPLSHHARMFGLQAAVAIRLRSIQSTKTDFVLEFFLPVGCIDVVEQRNLLTSLSLLMQEYFQSLRVITDKELTEEVNPTRLGGADHSNDGACRQEVLEEQKGSHPERTSYQYSPTNCFANANNVSLFSPEKPGEVFTENSSGHNTNLEGFSECSREGSTLVEDSLSNASMGRRAEKRRMKAEKMISLQTLQKYFAGSLKDAAKSLGVCPTTLKRICRQHGIKRWPSRKIKKVGHSLQKLQVVIDSVKDTSGSFQIDSFYTNFSELGSPNMGGIITPPSTKHNDNPQTTTSKSLSSSCSQSSSSSHCYSSRTRQQRLKWNSSICSSPMAGDNSGGYQMKRARSEAHLSTPNQGRTILPRSKSHRNLGDGKDDLLHALKDSKKVTEEEDSQRIKVAYGNKKIRFRMHKEWGWKELLWEIGRRFSIRDIGVFDIKYLDDDLEWVLLTCDADLEECLYVYRLTQRATIKLSIQLSRHRRL